MMNSRRLVIRSPRRREIREARVGCARAAVITLRKEALEAANQFKSRARFTVGRANTVASQRLGSRLLGARPIAPGQDSSFVVGGDGRGLRKRQYRYWNVAPGYP